MKVLSFLSTVQQLVLTAGHLWPRFGRRFYHALKTANYTKSDSGPSILLSSILLYLLSRSCFKFVVAYDVGCCVFEYC